MIYKFLSSSYLFGPRSNMKHLSSLIFILSSLEGDDEPPSPTHPPSPPSEDDHHVDIDRISKLSSDELALLQRLSERGRKEQKPSLMDPMGRSALGDDDYWHFY